jgi:hypothetical protein
VSERFHHGRLKGSIAEVVDAGIELLPDFELAAIPLLDGAERPAEWPEVRRRLRSEGIRAVSNRGVLLFTPGDLERVSSVGMLNGNDELFLCRAWDEEFEAFPGRLTTEVHDLETDVPLGLEEWMHDTGCILALGDGEGLNFATSDDELATRLKSRFKPARV